MTDNERLAKALGLRLIIDPATHYRDEHNKIVCLEDGLTGYLNSPAGEKAVRDKVRELWVKRADSVAKFNDQWLELHITADSILLYLVGLKHLKKPFKVFKADTKSEAYAAACVWLADELVERG